VCTTIIVGRNRSAAGQLFELYFDHDRQTWVLARRLA